MKKILTAILVVAVVCGVFWLTRRHRGEVTSGEVAPVTTSSPVAVASLPIHPPKAIPSRVPGFSPRNPQAAIKRAREIIAASPSLGLQPYLPLGNAVAHAGNVSAQVFFEETLQGIPLSPRGSVTVDLGPEGELISLSSDYVAPVRALGGFTLSENEAKLAALAAVPGAGPQDIHGIRRVIWVENAPEGRAAYEQNVKGHRVVIDAESGSVLSNRDQRHY